MMAGPITGTFIDEITYDIPSANWSEKQWRDEFDSMQKIGIDTLILIRGGFEHRVIFPSAVIPNEESYDFAGLVLEEAEKRNMKVFIGLYISNLDWNKGDSAGELRKNKPFIEEIWHRYGSYSSFAGWYIPHETSGDEFHITEVMRGLTGMCKDRFPEGQVLISPFFRTEITYPGAGWTPQRVYEEWYELFSRIGKGIDICAFQDGSAPFLQMDAYYTRINQLCREFGIRHWINTETFERDPRHQFYPIAFPVLQQKLRHHQPLAEKLITFEFSHFMSPQSIYPSARNLYRLYSEAYGLKI